MLYVFLECFGIVTFGFSDSLQFCHILVDRACILKGCFSQNFLPIEAITAA